MRTRRRTVRTTTTAPARPRHRLHGPPSRRVGGVLGELHVVRTDAVHVPIRTAPSSRTTCTMRGHAPGRAAPGAGPAGSARGRAPPRRRSAAPDRSRPAPRGVATRTSRPQLVREQQPVGAHVRQDTAEVPRTADGHGHLGSEAPAEPVRESQPPRSPHAPGSRTRPAPPAASSSSNCACRSANSCCHRIAPPPVDSVDPSLHLRLVAFACFSLHSSTDEGGVVSVRRLVLTGAAMAAVALALARPDPRSGRGRPTALAQPQRTVDTARRRCPACCPPPDSLAWAVWAWGALGLALTAASAVPGVRGRRGGSAAPRAAAGRRPSQRRPRPRASDSASPPRVPS